MRVNFCTTRSERKDMPPRVPRVANSKVATPGFCLLVDNSIPLKFVPDELARLQGPK